MRVTITQEHTITMVQAGTMASSRSTASTGAMMARPLDPRMPAASVAQVSGSTEQRNFLCSFHESTCSVHDICLATVPGISVCPSSIHLLSVPPTFPSWWTPFFQPVCPCSSSAPLSSTLIFSPFSTELQDDNIEDDIQCAKKIAREAHGLSPW